MSEPKSIEVFQDLALLGPPRDRNKLRDALIQQASLPWSHAEAAEKRLASRPSILEGELLAFERLADNALPAAGLTLWSRPSGYEVTNIVPKEFGELGYAKYNALLQDFAERIAEPAAQLVGYTVATTSSRQSLEELTSADVAKELRRFSEAANKSTGSSHPLDRRRWFSFLIAAHGDRDRLDADHLGRWLVEVEGWDEERAHRLVSEYEFARDLLVQYDQHLT